MLLTTRVRTGSDYGVEINVDKASEDANILGSQVTLWGVPADPSHDASRGWECLSQGTWVEGAVPARPCTPLKATGQQSFLTLPTTCRRGTSSRPSTGDAWTGQTLSGEFRFPTPFDGCNLLQLHPDSHGRRRNRTPPARQAG